MDDYVGIVCGRCDAFNPMRASICVQCEGVLASNDTGTHEAGAPQERGLAEPPSALAAVAGTIEEERMDQARNYVCKECSNPVPPQSKFCGVCGARLTAAISCLDVLRGVWAPRRREAMGVSERQSSLMRRR